MEELKKLMEWIDSQLEFRFTNSKKWHEAFAAGLRHTRREIEKRLHLMENFPCKTEKATS